MNNWNMGINAGEIVILQFELIEKWHSVEPPDEINDPSLEQTMLYIISNNLCNYKLWHEEDFARRRDVKDSEIATVKRNIDGWNQKRNDFIEKIDDFVISEWQDSIKMTENAGQNSETIGSIIDRLSILNLKIFHMAEMVEVYPQKLQFSDKLAILHQQRDDLGDSLKNLISDISKGNRYIKTYRQMKMYNDPETNPQLNKTLRNKTGE